MPIFIYSMNQQTLHELLAKAMDASQRGDSEQAIAQLRELSQQAGVDGRPLLLLAGELASAGHMPEAEAAYAGSILRSPGLSIARFQLGLLQVSSGRVALGVLTWQALLSLPMDDALYHYVAGYIALLEDRFDMARECFEAGLSLLQENDALMGDIRRTMVAMHQMSSGSSNDNVAQAAGQPDHHVLLSNYFPGDRRH